MTSIDQIRKVAVLGAGTMGAGIAQVCAAAAHSVELHDTTVERARAGIANIATALTGVVAKGKMTRDDADKLLARIRPHADVAATVREADLVIEAAPEDLLLKQDVFRTVARLAPPLAILATNTSSLSITRIAEAVAHGDRFVGLHFFNPPPVMKLLEIVRGDDTSDETVATCRALAVAWGKEPIVVRDSPGFASSRLGLALGLEAMRMLEEGVASASDIDTAMKLGYRHPMGPLELTDLVGLDVRLAIAEHLVKELDERRFRPPDILRKKVADGHVGKKAGRGFYDWSSGEAKEG